VTLSRAKNIGKEKNDEESEYKEEAIGRAELIIKPGEKT